MPEENAIRKLEQENKRLKKELEDVRLSKRDKKLLRKTQEENASLKIELSNYRQSVNNLSAELGKIKRKIQKGRV